jgi:hypothetical protein
VRSLRLRSVVLVAAALGMVVPIVSLYRYYRYDYLFGGGVVTFWPSSILLMVTDGHDHDSDVWVPIAISVIANMILYAAVAALVWFIVWIIRRVKLRTP